MSAWLIQNFYLVGIFGQKCILVDLGGIYCRQSAHFDTYGYFGHKCDHNSRNIDFSPKNPHELKCPPD